MKKLALLNTSILTTAGEYHLTDITLDEARAIVKNHRDNLDSAIGHASTAEIMTTLLGGGNPDEPPDVSSGGRPEGTCF